MTREALDETPLPAAAAARLIVDGYDHPWQCSTMALQKLLYLAHGHHLAWFGAPLIDDHFIRWASGPVSLSLYALHASVSNLDDCPEILGADTSGATEAQRGSISSILHAWQGISGPHLSNITLQHTPVRLAIEDAIIPDEALRLYFSGFVSGLDRLSLGKIAGADYRAQMLLSSLDPETREAVVRSVTSNP